LKVAGEEGIPEADDVAAVAAYANAAVELHPHHAIGRLGDPRC
jgi:hypothetical protein